MSNASNFSRRALLAGAAAAAMPTESVAEMIRKVQDSQHHSEAFTAVMDGLLSGKPLDSAAAAELLREATEKFRTMLSQNIPTLPPNAAVIIIGSDNDNRAAAVAVDCAKNTVAAFRGRLDDRRIFQFDATTQKAGIYKAPHVPHDTDAHIYEDAALAIQAKAYQQMMEEPMRRWIEQNQRDLNENPNSRSGIRL